MYKKRTLALVIASAFALQGCLDTDKSPENANVNQTDPTAPSGAGNVWPVFNPATSQLPIPNDLIFDSVASDGTFLVPDSAPPVTTALNSLSGASTTAPIDVALSGLIDSSTVDGNPFVLDASGNPTALPNANQNVFLVELDYASGSALQGLTISEPPRVITPTSATYTAEVKPLVDASGNDVSVIRINPKTPLKPNTRYVVAITNDILDTTGAPISSSPGLTGYGALTNSQVTPVDPALNPVAALINGLWEPTALGLINGIKSALSQPTITDSNLALTYSFTTSGDEAVLGYIANPASWFDDQLTTFIGVNTATSVITNASDVAGFDASGNVIVGQDGAVDYADVALSISGAIGAFPINAADPTDTTISDALGPLTAAFPLFPGCSGVTGGSSYISCIGQALANLPTSSGGFADLLPTPAATNITINNASTLDLTAFLGDPNALGIPAGLVNVVSGELSIPYYSGTPTTTSGAAIKYGNWVADDTLATAINSAFSPLGLSIPQADPNVSDVVNYIFPFPKQQDGDATTTATDNVTIPLIAMYPANPTGDMKTLIWQHGLTGNRTNVFGFGSALVANAKTTLSDPLDPTSGTDIAVVAIDIPLHGVDNTTDPLQAAFATGNERHFGFTEAGPLLPPTAIDLSAAGGSGSMFINLENLLNSRDSFRQHVLDLFTLRKSLGNIDFNPSSGDVPDLDVNDVYYSGHSLGTIGGQVFTAIANGTAATDDNIVGATFFTPGGGITRFVENSPTFAPSIVGGLAANLVTPDTTSYQSYLNTLQAALDSADPINFASDFASQTGTIHYVETLGDTVIPNSVDTDEETLNSPLGNGVSVDGSISFLAGSEPLTVEANSTSLTTAGTTLISTLDAPVVTTSYSSTAANHGTPSSGDPAQAFGEMVAEKASLVISGGTAITVVDDSIIE